MSSILKLHNTNEKKVVPSLMIGRFGISYIDLDSDNKPKIFDEISFANGSDVEEVKEALETILKKKKISKINLVVPEFDVSTFFTTIYIEKGQKERSVILDYIQKNTQMDPKDIVLDYDVVSHKDGVLIASVIVMSKDRYDWYVDILKTVKINPIRIISESMALSKSLVSKNNNEPHVIVSVLPTYTTLSVVDNNFVYKTEVIDECIDKDNLKRLSKKINSFMLDWYSQIGRVVHDRAHHIVVSTYSNEFSKELISSIRNTLNHINVKRGNSWENCFSIDEYIPEIHKKDLYRFESVIGGALFGKK